MNRVIAGKLFYAILFIALFVGILWLVTGGKWSVVLFSAPLLLWAEAVWFGNQYLNLYEDGHEEEEAHEVEARVHSMQHRIAH